MGWYINKSKMNKMLYFYVYRSVSVTLSINMVAITISINMTTWCHFLISEGYFCHCVQPTRLTFQLKYPTDASQLSVSKNRYLRIFSSFGLYLCCISIHLFWLFFSLCINSNYYISLLINSIEKTEFLPTK